MNTTKRLAAVIAAAVVTLAMVTPTAALATNGDRGHDRGHAAGDRDDRDDDRDHRKQGKHDRDDREAKADRAKGDEKAAQKREAKQHDKRAAKAERATHDDDEHEKRDEERNAKADRTEADRAKHDTSRNADQVADDETDADDDRGRWNVKAPLCHATASATNPYVMITVSHKAIVKGTGHGGHADDIIPPFAYQPHRGADSATYPGLNWDAEGQALFANGCLDSTDGDVGGVGGADDTDDEGNDADDGAPDATDTIDTPTDVVADGDTTVEDEVLGVVIDADETAGEGDVEVLGVSGSADDTATAAEADVVADTEVQAAQSSDEESSPGVLAMTGGSLLVLLIAGLASLFAGTGLLRRRS